MRIKDLTMKTVKMKLLSLIALCAITSALNITQLKVPLYADPRRAAELSCHFQMTDSNLHSVKWYCNDLEIFRYSPDTTPPVRLFNVSDVKVQGGECYPDWCTLQVMPPPVATLARYSCEVSTNGPRFQIIRVTKQMNVVAIPDGDPVISSAHDVLKPGESVFLNCTSDFSLPPAEINWYIDDELQKPEAWEKTEHSLPQQGGLRQSWRAFRLRVPTTASAAIRVRCEAVLLVEPQVVRGTDTIITIHSRTQLSKYVANIYNSGTKKQAVGVVLLVITLTFEEISRFMSL